MKPTFVNIHTHRPAGHGIELRVDGVHPWEASQEAVGRLEATLAKGDASIPQAIGEIGLDGVRGPARELQQEAFRAQLTLAEQYGLPVVLHCVRAFAEVMRTLAEYRLRAVIFHGFVGSPEQACEALTKGYYLSFGERSFASPKTVRAMRVTPMERLFLETDDSPTPIATIYAQAAELSGIGIAELQAAMVANYERIFTEHG